MDHYSEKASVVNENVPDKAAFHGNHVYFGRGNF